MRDPVHIAQRSYRKALSADDSYDRFVYLWFALNALYNEFHESGERRAMGDLVYSRRYHIGREIDNILEAPYAEFFKKRIIRDCRGNGFDTGESAAVLRNSDYSPKKRLRNLLYILYQVRCNLFHGNKMFGRDSDNEVVANAASALTRIIEAFLKIGHE